MVTLPLQKLSGRVFAPVTERLLRKSPGEPVTKSRRASSLSNLTATFFEPHRLTNAFPKEVQLRTTNFAAANNYDLFDLRRVKRKLALHTFIGHDPPHENISRLPEPLREMTTPVKIWTRSLSPSKIFVCTSTVSPMANFGTSDLRLDFSTISRICWLINLFLIVNFHVSLLATEATEITERGGEHHRLIVSLRN